mmetsp:Transcript_21560/g.46895  ORF Transcript_21560/g.46895 Transcript_21560/m.46895 type:complete len:231 (-) Transcript_21560:176-868(-)|eukprot:CAMPEP_0172318276 /NCGR_PEP_ID=MMETSP1058-20130122/34388_1 /TAXON_ID=83371 /ORGANISM="Detonula confervacea, Strain CCMP 353" /LENGTH=230 /DNA_ID=CAMNT_0013033063 /DNA_START=180 /DNA_END=872 /DNA_ORIENTATION=-
MKQKVFRPTLDDVERISLGKGARKRGTGSRYVPHRLNRDERQLYDQAKKKNYLIVKGTAYRRERKGSPLCNTFRQRCDALEQICVIIEKYGFGDRIKIDFSTLRLRDDRAHVSRIWNNLLIANYPDLIENAKDCTDDTKIDWEAVHSSSIWVIKERLITIDCADRAVAKSLAEDVLKESLKFHEIIIEMTGNEHEHTELDCNEIANGTNDVTENDKASDDQGDEIDWNDI